MRVHTILLSTVVTALCIAHSVLPGEEPKDLLHENFKRTSALVATGKVMDKEVMCILDTGATTCAMDMRFAAGLSISATTEQVGTASGLITVQRFEKISQQLTGFPQRTSPAVALDLTGFSVTVGMQIDVVLGMNYLKHLIFGVNNGIPAFSDRKEFQPASNAKLYPLSTVNGCPYIGVELPVLGERPFLIDTGWVSYCGITKDYASQLVRTNDAVILDEIPALDASGVQRKNLYVIREMKFMGTTIRDVPAVESEVNGIGLGLMRHFNFSIDFQNSAAYVLPSTSTGPFFDLDASGLRAVFKPEFGHVLRRIVPGSPAEKNSLQVGDQLLRIDGRSASEMSAWEVRELLSQAGKTIAVKVKSGDQVRDVQLPLSRKYEYPPKWKPRSTQADDFQKFIESESAAAPK